MMFVNKNKLLAAIAMIGAADAFFGTSRFNTDGGSPPMTCGGALFTDQVRANVRGENPDVPISLLARYPLLNPFTLALSWIHVISALIVLVIIYTQLILKKGTPSHVLIGRFMKFAIMPHFFIIAYVLNCMAISMSVEDWKLAPPTSDWRAQVAYIVPFGACTTVAAYIAFFLNRNAIFSTSIMITAGKVVCLGSIAWWCTIGLYMSIDQISGGLGNFGTFNVPAYGKAQIFFVPLNVVLLLVGSFQAALDFINYRVLCIIQADGGNSNLLWLDQHKWGVFVFCYQALVIVAVFVAYFPYCLYGLPEWTCISTPLLSIPFLGVMFIPLLPQFPNAIGFGRRMLLGARLPSAKNNEIQVEVAPKDK